MDALHQHAGLLLFLTLALALTLLALRGRAFARPLPAAPFPRPLAEFAMRAGLTVAVLAAGLYIILSRQFSAESEKWAYGAIGALLGFWLKPAA